MAIPTPSRIVDKSAAVSEAQCSSTLIMLHCNIPPDPELVIQPMGACFVDVIVPFAPDSSEVSVSEPAAVHIQRMAGNKAGLVAQQE